jgi:hypothetical protein
MNPDFDLRLKSMRRALTTIIMPAIEPGNQLAQEQAAILVGQLDMLAMQWNRAEPYARLCHDELLRLVTGLRVAGGSETKAAWATLQAVASDHSAPAAAAFNSLSAAMEDLVRAADRDGDAAFRRQLHRDVLLYGHAQAARDRSWFVQCGFDVNAAELKGIDEILAAHAEGRVDA